MSFDSRCANHSFEEGEVVKIADDIPSDMVCGLMQDDDFLKRVNSNILKNKFGVVKSCASDLHSFSQGTFYNVIVDFNGFIVSGSAAYFLPLDINEKRQYIAKKRFEENDTL